MSSAYVYRTLLTTGVLIFFISAFNCFDLGSVEQSTSIPEVSFAVLAILSTTLLLLLPIWILQKLGNWLLPNKKAVALISIITSFSMLIILIGDYRLYYLYGFHINGFVLNLVMTPGGIASLGASQSTYLSIVEVLLVSAVIFAAIIKFIPLERFTPALLHQKRFWTLAFLLSFFSQAYSYAHAEYQYDKRILSLADRIAFHIPVTAKRFFDSHGYEKPQRISISSIKEMAGGKLVYPRKALNVQPSSRTPYNIIWLVAESWRWDMLDPQIMPQTWKFSQQAIRLKNHYSGGNGTRMGMFSQFYSLYGSYWFDILRSHRQPVVFDALDQLGYQKFAVTSAKFSYPEFDQTIFAGFKDSQLQAFDEGEGWRRDRKNLTDLLAFMAQAKADKPFFSFMFFESPHANYYFPEESVIRNDYLKDMDYTTMNPQQDSQLMKNRYINACHHLDQQLGRVFDFLNENKLLDKTIVILTGDHGEEFMENGRWGHNSTFSQYQIRVPLVLSLPGSAPRVISNMTSHFDIVPTILPLLGVQNQSDDYGFGRNLLAADYHRDYTIVNDWHGPAIVTPNVKFILSKKAIEKSAALTTLNDRPLNKLQLSVADQIILGKFMGEHSQFLQR